MKVYDKILFSLSNKIIDVFGKEEMYIESSLIKHIISSIYDVKTIPNRLSYDEYSVVVNVNSNLLLSEVHEKILGNMQKVETMYWQYILNASISHQDWQVYEKYLEMIDKVKDGVICKDDFAKEMDKLEKKFSKEIKSVLLMDNLVTMNSIILDEITHTEIRMIDCINSQIDNLKKIYPIPNYRCAIEKKSFSLDADNVAFCVQDVIKSIYKTLDVASRWLRYLENMDNRKNKVEPVYFSDAKKAIEKFNECQEKKRLLELCILLNPLTTIRNEVIHNVSLNSNRQFVLAGVGTPCINNHMLYYSDILFWDYNGMEIERTHNRIGFYTKQKNALSELRYFYILTIEFITLCIKYYYKLFSNKLIEQNILKILTWSNNGVMEQLCTMETSNILNMYNEITFE